MIVRVLLLTAVWGADGERVCVCCFCCVCGAAPPLSRERRSGVQLEALLEVLLEVLRKELLEVLLEVLLVDWRTSCCTFRRRRGRGVYLVA